MILRKRDLMWNSFKNLESLSILKLILQLKMMKIGTTFLNELISIYERLLISICYSIFLQVPPTNFHTAGFRARNFLLGGGSASRCSRFRLRQCLGAGPFDRRGTTGYYKEKSAIIELILNNSDV